MLPVSSESAEGLAGTSRRLKVLVALNPQSGVCVVDDVKRELDRHSEGVDLQFHELGAGEDLGGVIEQAVADGVEMVIAGGGDGTVSAIAGLLVGTDIPFALLPLGTANVLALELGVPTDLAGACRLAASRWVERDHEEKSSTIMAIDAMKVDQSHYLTQAGVGIDALMIQTTSSESKRRLGKLAYLISATKHILAFKSHRFTVTVDGVTRKLRAAQIVVANTGMMGQPSFRWGPDIAPDDGRINVCFIKSAGVRDYLRLFWVVFRGHREKHPNMRHQTVDRSITIKSRSKRRLPVQADGEIIGETPVTIDVVHHALKVVVPSPRFP